MALLTAQQLAKLRDIIRDASTAVAISTTGMEVTDEELQRLADEGYVDAGDLHNIVLDSFELGRLMEQLPGARQMGYQAFLNYLAKNPVELSDQERRAYEFLQGRAGQFCVGLGTRYEGEMQLAAADMDQQLAEAFRYSIQSESGQATARREAVGELTTRLRQMSEDWARDWGRIASTESHMAHQMGLIESTAEQYGMGEGMAKIPEPNACDDCKRLYLDADGKPMVRPVEWWMSQGVANYGLKRADWRSVMGAMHPWCQCQVVRVPAGWGFDDEWDMVPLEETEKSSSSPTLTVQTFQKSRKLHYKIKWKGLTISIENRKGSVRHWYDPHTKTEGTTTMRWPYGYFNLTEGADGDHVDCFVGPHQAEAKNVYVIHQMKSPSFRTFDEDKVMVGFMSAAAAKRAYLKHFSSPRFFGSMDAVPAERFAQRIKDRKLANGERIRKAEQMGLFAKEKTVKVLSAGGGLDSWVKLKKSKQQTFNWEPAPGSKKGALRRRKAGGGYNYLYPGQFEVPAAPERTRGFEVYKRRQQEINTRAAAAPIAAVSTVYLNVSGGGEKARFVPLKGVSGLGGRNLGVQITAHEVPKSAKAIDRFAQHARREGLKLMVDSGEFPRFAAERRLAAADKPDPKLEAKAAPLDFDSVYDAYDRLADAFPAGTLTVTAPDRIGDAELTAELRARYSARTKALIDRGVTFIVPFQARTPDGLERDYVAAAEAFGEGNFVIGLPMAKKPMPMEVMVPFVTKLYQRGLFPRLHFLGGSQPEQMAARTVQLVAAAYWSARGLPEQRVLELARSPLEAVRSVSKVLTQPDVLTREADHELEARVQEWAGEGADITDAWVDFFEAHPEEFDLEVEDMGEEVRKWSAELVQFDTSTVNRAVMVSKEHALGGAQVPVSDYLEATPKRERHPGTLDRYIQSREYQLERHVPRYGSGIEALYGKYDKSLRRWPDLVKSRFGGTAGYVGITRPVGTMGNVGKPARTPGANTYAAQAPTDHPYGPDARKKKRKKKRKKEDRKKEKDAIAISPVRYTDGYSRDKPVVDGLPELDTERNREWLDSEQERRAKRLGSYSLRPQDVRS
jgi:hypothetical protein